MQSSDSLEMLLLHLLKYFAFPYLMKQLSLAHRDFIPVERVHALPSPAAAGVSHENESKWTTSRFLEKVLQEPYRRSWHAS